MVEVGRQTRIRWGISVLIIVCDNFKAALRVLELSLGPAYSMQRPYFPCFVEIPQLRSRYM